MNKDEMDIHRQIEFHINTALSILDEAVNHHTVDLDILNDLLHDCETDADDDMEAAVWKAFRQYTA